MNRLKQIILGSHSYATANNGRLPYYLPNGRPLVTPFLQILPYCGNDRGLFRSPADPSHPGPAGNSRPDLASYAANGQVFIGEPMLPGTFRDGAANTIAFAEHYAYCGNVIYGFSMYLAPGKATFAEPNVGTFPVTRGNPPVSSSYFVELLGFTQYADVTFQAAPSTADCLPYFAQTPHPSGMLTAFADGSVRQLSPGIAPPVYWALVTPAGGESVEVPD